MAEEIGMTRRQLLAASVASGGLNALRPAAQKMLTCKVEAPSANMEPDSKIALFNIIMTNG